MAIAETGVGIGIGILKDVFMTTSFSGSVLLMQLTIVFVSMLIITRNIGEWKTLAFPVILLFSTIGMHFSWVLIAGTGAMFVLDAISIPVLTSGLGTAQSLVLKKTIKGAKTTRKKLWKGTEYTHGIGTGVDKLRSEATKFANIPVPKYLPRKSDIQESLHRMNIKEQMDKLAKQKNDNLG